MSKNNDKPQAVAGDSQSPWRSVKETPAEGQRILVRYTRKTRTGFLFDDCLLTESFHEWSGWPEGATQWMPIPPFPPLD